jgi:hypothetical protein
MGALIHGHCIPPLVEQNPFENKEPFYHLIEKRLGAQA